MPETTLNELLERNARHVESLPGSYFSDVQDAQRPAAVSICCSDSRVSQTGMWSVDRPGWLFTPSRIGNVVWDEHDGERVIEGSVHYPITYTETKVTLIVGHTGCGAITAALDAVRGGGFDGPAGVGKFIELLEPVIRDGLADSRIDGEAGNLVDMLVEYNVDRQVEFLFESDEIPADERVFGFVYDLHGTYTDQPGRAYLVNADGDTDLDRLRDIVDPEWTEHVRRLL